MGSADGLYVDTEGREDMQLYTLRVYQCDVTSPDDKDVGVMNVISLV